MRSFVSEWLIRIGIFLLVISALGGGTFVVTELFKAPKEPKYFLRADDQGEFIGGFYLDDETIKFRGNVAEFIRVWVQAGNKKEVQGGTG